MKPLFMKFKQGGGSTIVVNVQLVRYVMRDVNGSVLFFGSGENDWVSVSETIEEIGARQEWANV